MRLALTLSSQLDTIYDGVPILYNISQLQSVEKKSYRWGFSPPFVFIWWSTAAGGAITMTILLLPRLQYYRSDNYAFFLFFSSKKTKIYTAPAGTCRELSAIDFRLIQFFKTSHARNCLCNVVRIDQAGMCIPARGDMNYHRRPAPCCSRYRVTK